MPIRRLVVLCLATALGLSAAEPNAANLFKQGRKAERDGDVVSAYLLYSEAAAKAPTHPEYWARSQALRTRAALAARPMPAPSPPETRAPEAQQPVSGPPSGITAEDLEEVRRLRPPPELKPAPGRKDLDLRGDAKAIFEQTARAFGLEAVFDGDYQPGPPLHVRIDDADYRQALHTLAAASSSFVVPLSARVFLVAKDTPQKRAGVEPVVAVSIPIPQPVTVQEAQELARAVQQAMEIVKLVVDPDRRMVLIRDRISKVRPAQALFEQLAQSRAQVAIEVQFLEVDKSSLISYGLLLPNDFPIVFVGTGGIAGAAGAVQSLASFLFGHPMFGLGIANAQVFASMSRTLGKNLLEAEVRSLDGATATFHVGVKYPIATAAFLGRSIVPPSFNFEDLGLSLKITPHVHGMDEVSLDVNAEFKVLAGQSTNGMPILSNRKMESKVRLRNGQWAIVAGLMSASEARTITGIAGLSTLPVLGRLFRKNEVDSASTEVVLVLKPVLLDLPPSESVNRTLYLGSEGRLNIPL